MKLTRFDHVGSYILKARLNLPSYKVRGYDMHACDAFGVLDCERRGGSHGVAAVCGEDFLVCFQAAVITLSSVNILTNIYMFQNSEIPKESWRQ